MCFNEVSLVFVVASFEVITIAVTIPAISAAIRRARSAIIHTSPLENLEQNRLE